MDKCGKKGESEWGRTNFASQNGKEGIQMGEKRRKKERNFILKMKGKNSVGQTQPGQLFKFLNSIDLH